ILAAGFLLSSLPHMFADTNVADDPAADESESSEAAPTKEDEKDDEPEKEPKTIEELTKDSDLIDGLFPIYRDRKTGEVRLLLSEEHLDKSYLYFTYVENGVSD